jgi:hypothetical protein
MDDIVKAALAKWPHVPACFGWLGLDERGNWYMRDDRVQAAGPFSAQAGGTLASKGSLLHHHKLVEFIARNYESDAQGQWFFQNGPQRVYVELQATPLIWRLDDCFALTSHTGVAAEVLECVLDEQGYVYLHTDCGFGLVHTQDVSLAANAIEQGVWAPHTYSRAELPGRYLYVVSPEAQNKKKPP